ncbi:COPII coat assembly protein [Venturia nashicola]|uniref:COPII coat assembly protein n=1 Tax=Venturia nashicola TaxID=86259 RepID=A0A4Z1NXH4_9PEZI|nr:COPII coat assembly protein [Venturia nashicola]TLD31706.1 COPII coat assembly protein [Venturia nashicola]
MRSTILSLLALSTLALGLPQYPPLRYSGLDENPLLADRTAPSAPSNTPLNTVALMAGAATRVVDSQRPLHTTVLMAMAHSRLPASPSITPTASLPEYKDDL